MRKVIVSMFASLDGVSEAPHEWSFAFWNDEIQKLKRDELFAADALLLGRVTYEGFAAAWPSRKGDEFSDRINSLPKLVVSTTLAKADWNNSTLIKANVPAEISKLKREPGQDIIVYGGTSMVHTLMQHDLIDQYRLLVYPIVLGKGKRLFADGSSAKLALAHTQAFGSGVVLLSYTPAKANTAA